MAGLTKIQTRVLGFVKLNDGKYTPAEVEDLIEFSFFEIRHAIEDLFALGRLEMLVPSGKLKAAEKKNGRFKKPSSSDLEKAPDPRSNAARAISAALRGPYAPLRRAAVEVLRAALTTSRNTAEAARKLGVHEDSLYRIRDEFPELWADASSRVGSKTVRAI